MDKLRLFFVIGVLRRFAWGSMHPTVSQLARENLCKALPRTDDHLWEERASVIRSSWPQLVKTHSLSKRRRSVFLACGEILGLLAVA